MPGHQNSGAPTFFGGVFLMVFLHLCWQCFNKTRKCQEHKNTLRKKEKLIFLMPILEIKTKNLFFSWKGHQSSGAWAPELWRPYIFLGIFLMVWGHQSSGVGHFLKACPRWPRWPCPWSAKVSLTQRTKTCSVLVYFETSLHINNISHFTCKHLN